MEYPSGFSRDRIGVIIGVKDPATLQATCYGGSSANEIFMGKSYGEGGVIVVYYSCWDALLGIWEHEPLIIALFILIVSRRKWEGPWTICGSDWGHGAVKAFEMECKQEWGQSVPITMEGELQQVSEEGSENWGGILRKFLCRARSIPSMLESVVLRLLRWTPKGWIFWV